jgi:hypothetical protein
MTNPMNWDLLWDWYLKECAKEKNKMKFPPLIQSIRDAALDEAAFVCENMMSDQDNYDAAVAIRALKGK